MGLTVRPGWGGALVIAAGALGGALMAFTAGESDFAPVLFLAGLLGLAVAVMACDDEVIPSQERIESVGDDSDLREVYDTERYLLYVACTRARDQLLITGVDPASEFLDDLSQ